jgi:PAS domain-containing protein
MVRKDKMNKATLKLLIMPLLIICCTLFYYFGELVNWAAWEALRIKFFYGIHDIHRLLFLAPIIYAGYTARIKGAVIVTLVAFIIFLPRAFFISPFPDPLLRMLLFTVFAAVIGIMTGVIRNQLERSRKLEAEIRSERSKLLGVVDKIEDGVLITGPDYRIRFANSAMRRNFGEGTGSFCYKYLQNLDQPCEAICKLPNVVQGAVERWPYCRPDGRIYEVVASPCIDANGTVCQLSVFRDVTHKK